MNNRNYSESECVSAKKALAEMVLVSKTNPFFAYLFDSQLFNYWFNSPYYKSSLVKTLQSRSQRDPQRGPQSFWDYNLLPAVDTHTVCKIVVGVVVTVALVAAAYYFFGSKPEGGSGGGGTPPETIITPETAPIVPELKPFEIVVAEIKDYSTPLDVVVHQEVFKAARSCAISPGSTETLVRTLRANNAWSLEQGAYDCYITVLSGVDKLCWEMRDVIGPVGRLVGAPESTKRYLAFLLKFFRDAGLDKPSREALIEQLIETRRAFPLCNPFDFFNTMLCHAAQHQQIFVADGPAKFLHTVYFSPEELISPY
jgi:hypothetical protein